MQTHIYNVVYHYNPTSNRNRNYEAKYNLKVVYHYNPTSNRNVNEFMDSCTAVVYHYNPTSNRNNVCDFVYKDALYIIIILHQTATMHSPIVQPVSLYIIIILHQTATTLLLTILLIGCISL